MYLRRFEPPAVCLKENNLGFVAVEVPQRWPLVGLYV